MENPGKPRTHHTTDRPRRTLRGRILQPDPNFEYVHGTFFNNVPGICERGILSGGVEGLKGRQMIHMVKIPKNLPRGYRAAGLRSKCEALVYVDMVEAMKNGIRFFNTANDSIVTQVGTCR